MQLPFINTGPAQTGSAQTGSVQTGSVQPANGSLTDGRSVASPGKGSSGPESRVTGSTEGRRSSKGGSESSPAEDDFEALLEGLAVAAEEKPDTCDPAAPQSDAIDTSYQLMLDQELLGTADLATQLEANRLEPDTRHGPLAFGKGRLADGQIFTASSETHETLSTTAEVASGSSSVVHFEAHEPGYAFDSPLNANNAFSQTSAQVQSAVGDSSAQLEDLAARNASRTNPFPPGMRVTPGNSSENGADSNAGEEATLDPDVELSGDRDPNRNLAVKTERQTLLADGPAAAVSESVLPGPALDGAQAEAGTGSHGSAGLEWNSNQSAPAPTLAPLQTAAQSFRTVDMAGEQNLAEFVQRVITERAEEAVGEKNITRIEIAIDPPELGEVRIEITKTATRTVATLAVANEIAWNQLQSNIQNLQASLEAMGVEFNEVDRFDQQQDGWSRERDESEAGGQVYGQGETWSTDDPSTQPETSRAFRLKTARIVDILI
ncbi:MAG: flagellar hook-length control protein FliK [Planctomycetota bacterium]|nr:flagellar hook-length control protein FliK [Planctomycetota bacterium]